MSQLYFPKHQWFSLPLSFRQRWWAETDWGMKPPSEELLAEGKRLVAERKRA